MVALVVVAFPVMVAFRRVTFWRVVEPVTRRLPSVARPAFKVEAPMLIEPKPPVMEPAFKVPTVARLERPTMCSGEVEEK